MAGQDRVRSRRVSLHFAWLDQPTWKLSGIIPGPGRGSQRRIALPREVGVFRIRHDPTVIRRHETGQKWMLDLPRSERGCRTFVRAVLSGIAEGRQRKRNHQAKRRPGNEIADSSAARAAPEASYTTGQILVARWRQYSAREQRRIKSHFLSCWNPYPQPNS